MSRYKEFEEAVFNWLNAKHKENPPTWRKYLHSTGCVIKEDCVGASLVAWLCVLAILVPCKGQIEYLKN